ncbi:hypothetical protein [Pseudomonas koreensis]|uniref:Uncharacterized protein n=1 Tax=Pseudomonas koreensis TaxID=198620 RepID=A0AA94EPN4_9PSED|nr:hypothetical protein [Pseudomonas koreensis]RVD77753.1 hypothetical protein A9HBioS_2220 [Pseudomonas koreensis]
MTISDTQSASDKRLSHYVDVCIAEPGKAPISFAGDKTLSYVKHEHWTLGVLVGSISRDGETVRVTFSGPDNKVLECVSVHVDYDKPLYLMFDGKYKPSLYPPSATGAWFAHGDDPSDLGSKLYFND